MLEDIKVDIQSIWVSFIEAVVRFWNNRFIKDNDEVLYLRLELEKSNVEVKRLMDIIIESNKPNPVGEPEINTNDYKPITGGYIPWDVKRRQLELASRETALQLQREAKLNIAKLQSTEELEDELGVR